MTSTYAEYILTMDNCKSVDVWSICLRSIEDDIARYYPEKYNVVLDVTKVCEGCASYGRACNDNSDCSTACVHKVCRPNSPWCGDGVCDAGEVCDADCAVEEIVEEETTEKEVEEAVVEEETKNSTEEVKENQTRTQGNVTITTQTTQESSSKQKQSIYVAKEQDLVSELVRGDDEFAGPNWLGAIIVVILGIVGLIAVFTRKKKAHY